MTEQQKREAIKHTEGQLKHEHVDLSSCDQDELEVIKEAMNALKYLDECTKVFNEYSAAQDHVWDF